jgi:hypothetical protein
MRYLLPTIGWRRNHRKRSQKRRKRSGRNAKSIDGDDIVMKRDIALGQGIVMKRGIAQDREIAVKKDIVLGLETVMTESTDPEEIIEKEEGHTPAQYPDQGPDLEIWIASLQGVKIDTTDLSDVNIDLGAQIGENERVIIINLGEEMKK